jgi:hypothetical protein
MAQRLNGGKWANKFFQVLIPSQHPLHEGLGVGWEKGKRLNKLKRWKPIITCFYLIGEGKIQKMIDII